MLITGPVSLACRELLQEVWLDMPRPRAALLVGVCACSMGGYRTPTAWPGPPDKVIREVDPGREVRLRPGLPAQARDHHRRPVVKLLEAL